MALGDITVGQETTYTGATIPTRQLGEYIYSTDKNEYPILKAIGMDSMDEAIKVIKFEWLKFTGIATTDTINEGGAYAVAWGRADVCECSGYGECDG